jgi:hypothetical protein
MPSIRHGYVGRTCPVKEQWLGGLICNQPTVEGIVVFVGDLPSRWCGFVHVDYAGCLDSRRSTTGNVV